MAETITNEELKARLLALEKAEAEWKRSEESLKESQRILHALMRSIPDLVWLKDREGKFLFCNSKFEKLYGVEERDLIGKTDYEFVGKEMADGFRLHDALAATKGKTVANEEEVVYLNDGHREIIETVKTPVFNPDGRLAGILGIGRDITERKRLEREALDNLRFFENMDRVNRVMQAGIDVEGTLSDVLDAVLSVFGCDRTALVYACDPEAPGWTILMERTNPAFPSIYPPGTTMPMNPTLCRKLLETDGPVEILPGKEAPRDEIWAASRIRSFLGKALYPKVGKPWVFSLQQCSWEREWTSAEKRLFRGIGRRVADGLTSLLMYRDLRQNKEFLDNIIENIPNMIFLVEAETSRIARVNRVCTEFLGYSAGELAGRRYEEIFPKEVADSLAARDRETLETGTLVDIPEETVRKRSGEERILHTKKIPVTDETGIPKYVLGISEDITERKQAEAERQFNLRFFENMDRVNRAIQGTNDLERMMRDVLEGVLSAFACDRAYLMYACDPEADTWFSPMERTNPRYPGILIGEKTPLPMTPPIQAKLRVLLATDGPAEFLSGRELNPEDEPWKTYEIKSLLGMALYPKVGKPWEFGLQQCSHVRTWTSHEKKLFQEIGRRLSDALTSLLVYRDLQRNKEFLDTLFENIPSVMYVKDAETLRYVRINRAGEQFLGRSREELLGKEDLDLFPKEKADRIGARDRETASTGTMIDIPEETVRMPSGEERIFRTRKIPIPGEAGKPAFLLGISEDVTERSRLEEQLRQAQKMESIGRLAGGVAHDFNNMLGIIIGQSELALGGVIPGEPIGEHLQEIRKAADRSADLTRQLLTFARKQVVDPRVLDLNETLEGMLKMLRSLIGEQIRLEWLPGEPVGPVRMDPSQLNQILANLCVNARDAIPDVGRITIETGNVTFDESYCSSHPDFLPGDFVLLAVSDTGAGMEKETVARIFEPFFTTKELGKGTGLGLATVYGIVKQNDGFIHVHSEPGEGTTFRVYLPRQGSRKAQPPVEAPAGPVERGKETVLLVEDMPEILNMAGLMLERFGYNVIAASTPEEALRVAEERRGEIQLLVSDVIMPGMNGRVLAQRISSIHPGIKRLFMSGYTDNIIAQHGMLDEGVHFIQKPFSMQNFARKVREALDDDK